MEVAVSLDLRHKDGLRTETARRLEGSAKVGSSSVAQAVSISGNLSA